ncbi:MAG: hypothetical protein PHO33_03090 [Clostridia bacterium]|nr:hypothetical protein [Clostridia bacterium]
MQKIAKNDYQPVPATQYYKEKYKTLKQAPLSAQIMYMDYKDNYNVIHNMLTQDYTVSVYYEWLNIILLGYRLQIGRVE